MKPNFQKVLQPLLHVLLWIFFFLYPFFFDYVSFSDTGALSRIFLLTLFQSVLFYFNSLVLIPKLLAPKKIVAYLLVVVLIISAITCLSLLVHYYLDKDYHENGWVFYHFLYNSILLSLLVWGLSSGLKITSEWFKNERLKQEMENKKISAELLNLKSQVNPHFLFNSLNNIYALSNKSDDKRSAEAILKLSEMMRYMLYDSADEIVPLQKEIEYLENFIDLQRLRLKEDISVSFKVTGEIANKKIAPLLLIPFIENSFKHGVSYQHPSFIKIELNIDGNKLDFSISNSFFPGSAQNEKFSGIGLENVRRRLDLLYPKKHKLQIEKNESVFSVQLQIELVND